MLRRSFYGTNWERDLRGFLEEIGSRRGKAISCLHSAETRGISASVHGDNVTVKACREDAECLTQRFMEKYEIKTGSKQSSPRPSTELYDGVPEGFGSKRTCAMQKKWSEHSVSKAQVPPPRWE